MKTLLFNSKLARHFAAIFYICYICSMSLGCSSNGENDESDPMALAEHQTPIGHYPMSDIGISIASSGNRVLANYNSFDTGEYGVRLIDFSKPSSPALVDSIKFEGTGSINALQWNGKFAYVLLSYYLESETESGWITRLTEISTGNTTMEVKRIWDEKAYPNHMVQKDNTLYISTDLGIYVMDIETWTGELKFTFETGIPGFMSIGGDRLYLFGQSLGLATFDISTPSSPEQIGFYPFELDFSPRIFAKDNIVAFIIEGDLMLLDATNPDKPVLLEPVDVNGYAESLVISSINAYIAAGDTGAYQVDASDLEALKVLAICEPGYYVTNVALTEKALIVSGHENGISACGLIVE